MLFEVHFTCRGGNKNVNITHTHKHTLMHAHHTTPYNTPHTTHPSSHSSIHPIHVTTHHTSHTPRPRSNIHSTHVTTHYTSHTSFPHSHIHPTHVTTDHTSHPLLSHSNIHPTPTHTDSTHTTTHTHTRHSPEYGSDASLARSISWLTIQFVTITVNGLRGWSEDLALVLRWCIIGLLLRVANVSHLRKIIITIKMFVLFPMWFITIAI